MKSAIIADDETCLREYYALLLESNGYEVLAQVSTGKDAIQECLAFKDRNPLLLTDNMMPLMRGEDAIRFLKKTDPQQKVIFSSGTFSPELVEEMHTHGVICIPKPLTKVALLQALNKLEAA